MNNYRYVRTQQGQYLSYYMPANQPPYSLPPQPAPDRICAAPHCTERSFSDLACDKCGNRYCWDHNRNHSTWICEIDQPVPTQIVITINPRTGRIVNKLYIQR